MAPILKTENLMILLIIVFALRATICDALHAPKATVTITNDFNGTAATQSLTVHCKSKNDDIGTHIIPWGGQYSFSFHPRWWGGTLFFCGMQWHGTSHYFDIYVQDRDQPKCDHCCWFVKETGPCRCPCENPLCDTCFPWNN